MVYYEAANRGSYSTGELWHDSAVNAARMVEKYIHQEEQNLQLSEMLSGGLSDYEKHGANRKYIITETASDTFSAPVTRGTGEQKVGTLAGTTFLYRISGNQISVWDMLDKSCSRTSTLPAFRYDVTAVGIAESRDPASGYFLIVATIFEVCLFYFNPDKLSEEHPPALSGYVAATGGVAISAICAPNASKRIFLGADDGSIYELVYNLAQVRKNWFMSIFLGTWDDQRRCYLSVVHRPFVSTLPPLFRNLASMLPSGGDARVRAIQVDACRGLVYAISGPCSLSVYAISDGSFVGELSSYSISDSVRSAFRTASSSWQTSETTEIVDIIPPNPHIGGDIVCVLIAKSGARIFVRANRTSYGSVVGTPAAACKFCDDVRFKHYAYRVSSISIMTVRVPPTELSVDFAHSPDQGRTIVMACHDNRGAALVILSPDESSIVQRQQGIDSSKSISYRERFDVVPVSGKNIFALVLVNEGSLIAPNSLLLVPDCLLSVSVENHYGGIARSWRTIAISSEREVCVSPLTHAEELMALVSSENLYAIRDFSLQWKPEQVSALLIDLLSQQSVHNGSKLVPTTTSSWKSATETDSSPVCGVIEKILFAPETASAVGLVDAPGLGQSPQLSSFGPLGSVVQTQIKNISPRTRGVAILLSRILRPIWLSKAFVIEALPPAFISLKPAISACMRQYMLTLIGPVSGLLQRYRHELTLGSNSDESKIVEGFTVILNAVTESMELMRLVETGQLSLRKSAQSVELGDITNVLIGMDQILVRDLVMSAGIGESGLVEFLKTFKDLIDVGTARKHCPLIVPSI